MKVHLKKQTFRSGANEKVNVVFRSFADGSTVGSMSISTKTAGRVGAFHFQEDDPYNTEMHVPNEEKMLPEVKRVLEILDDLETEIANLPDTINGMHDHMLALNLLSVNDAHKVALQQKAAATLATVNTEWLKENPPVPPPLLISPPESASQSTASQSTAPQSSKAPLPAEPPPESQSATANGKRKMRDY